MSWLDKMSNGYSRDVPTYSNSGEFPHQYYHQLDDLSYEDGDVERWDGDIDQPEHDGMTREYKNQSFQQSCTAFNQDGMVRFSVYFPPAYLTISKDKTERFQG